MGIAVRGLDGVKATLEKAAEQAHTETLAALTRAGQRLVEIAKSTKQYQDQTGNLTASIGYGVYSKGSEISVGGFAGGEGEIMGRVQLAEVAARYNAYKYVLIIIAGMEYAVAVERRGYAVLDGALLESNSVVREELSSIRL